MHSNQQGSTIIIHISHVKVKRHLHTKELVLHTPPIGFEVRINLHMDSLDL